MKSDNATANRMATEASENVADTVQDIVEEVSDTHAGRPPAEVAEAVQEKWVEKQGESAPPLHARKAGEYAEHISKGRDVTVVPAEEPSGSITAESPDS